MSTHSGDARRRECGCSSCLKLIQDPSGVFRTVTFSHKSWNGRLVFHYRTMQHANIGRIYARALANIPKTNKRSVSGWADLARATGIITERPPGKKKTGMSSNVSTGIYGMAKRGTLPKDPNQRDKLFRLAGYPWR